MSLFSFNIRHNGVYEEAVGIDHLDVAEACREAMATMGHWFKDAACEFQPGKECEIQVTDEDKSRFTWFESPARDCPLA